MALQSITALANINLEEASPTVEFSDIPDTYRDLVLIFTGTGSEQTNLTIAFNSDSGSNYTTVKMEGTGGGASAADQSQTYLNLTQGTNINTSPTSNATVEIFDYSTTDKHKTILSRFNNSNDSTNLTAGRYKSTNAISTLLVATTGGDFNAGTKVALFGRIA